MEVVEMSGALLEEGAEALPGERQCRHHWVIATPNGTMSVGRCRRCGAVREFRNSTPESYYWGEEPSADSWLRPARSIEGADEDYSTASQSGAGMSIAL